VGGAAVWGHLHLTDVDEANPGVGELAFEDNFDLLAERFAFTFPVVLQAALFQTAHLRNE